MKKRQLLGAMLGAALACGTAYAEPDEPQGQKPCGDEPGMRPPCEGPGGGGMRCGRFGPEGAGNQKMRRGGGGPGEGREMPFNPERLKQAGATEQQVKALSDFQFAQQNKRIDLQAAAEKAELALEQLMREAGADEAAALKAADALTQARGELFKLGISTRIKTRQILGEEVLKKLRDQRPPEECGRPDNAKGRNAPPAGGRPRPPQAQK
ncbi:MAG: hypothetical protein PHV28_12995 [Kiritimatiellae bacterium]|nr:hypothetical protein [Kiritimatiellia bacterium]